MSEPWKPSIDRERELRDRIKELEAILEGSKGTVWYATVGENNELKAENQRLRELIEIYEEAGAMGHGVVILGGGE